jgi:hypothetical protein
VNETGKRFFILTSTMVFILSLVLSRTRSEVYRILLGNMNPLALVTLLAFFGYLLLNKLSSMGFSAHKPVNFSARLPYLGVAAILGFGMIIVDYLSHLPDDINILFPYSLLYYPFFGYIVEVLFHMVPLYLTLSLAKRFTALKDSKILSCLFLVCVFEPIFQLGLGFSVQIPLWTTLYIGLNIFFINLFQLVSYWRIDFFSMYAFRLTYYLFWHIIWGNLRLSLYGV